MKPQLFDLFQAQIRNEFESAYKYLGMAAYFETTPFKGFAGWMRLQAKEETEHAMKFFDYVHDRGHHLKLPAIQAMVTDYASPLEAFRETLAHEQLVTSLINEMYRVAVEVQDYAAQTLLQWYIAEQVEEEKQVQDFIDLLETAGSDVASLLIIDKSAAKRSS
jgi:ferritin